MTEFIKGDLIKLICTSVPASVWIEDHTTYRFLGSFCPNQIGIITEKSINSDFTYKVLISSGLVGWVFEHRFQYMVLC